MLLFPESSDHDGTERLVYEQLAPDQDRVGDQFFGPGQGLGGGFFFGLADKNH